MVVKPEEKQPEQPKPVQHTLHVQEGLFSQNYVFTKDPESGMRNIGTYRMQVFDGRTTGMHWQRHKGGAQHYRVAERDSTSFATPASRIEVPQMIHLTLCCRRAAGVASVRGAGVRSRLR